MKKILTLFLVIIGIVALAGCGAKKENVNQEGGSTQNEIAKKSSDGVSAVNGPCQNEKVVIPNYGDKGQRLKNCFVEYPGEPSRQDKNYHIVEDICGQFTQEFMENMLGEKISKIELPQIASLHNCSYYLNEKEYLLLNLEYLKIENQKKFYEYAGDKMENNPKIPMENLVVTKDDIIREIYFVLNPEKFISLKPSSKTTISNEKFIDLAAKIGAVIKDYK